MSKGKIALTVLIFILVTMALPLVLLLAFVDVNNLSVYIVVFGAMFFGSIGFMIAMLFKTKADIQEQIEELKVQNAAIAYRLTEMKKQGNIAQPVAEAKPEVKEDVKEKFDDFN
ncbi:MAG: hypothetical protein J6V78_01715 [Clostridia bacterium]|nr:hypothetical protein [Clostridia bacterium]